MSFIITAIVEIQCISRGSGILPVQVFPLSPNSTNNEVNWAS